MSDPVVVGLVAGFCGVLAAAVPAYIAQRKAPSRLTTDAVSLVDASGEVISNLTDEIARLEGVIEAHSRRILILENALRQTGIDPLYIR